MQAEKNQRYGRIAIIVVLVSGIIGTFAYKLMSSQLVDQGGHHRYFYHPYMQTLTMNFGQLLCLVIFYINLKTYKAPLEQGKTPHTFRVFLIPGLCDASLSVMQYMALNFISGSTYRILVGASIVTTLFFSKILLKITIEKRHLVGCGLGVIGLLIVGASGFIQSKSSTDDTSVSLQLLGYVLMLGSLVISGFLYSYEQLLMERHTIHPLQCVGWQGFFGLSIILTISIIFTFVPCTFGQELCVYNTDGDMFLQRFDQFFKEVVNSWVLILLVIMGVLTVSTSNASGVAITKYYDGLTRCLVVMSKTAGVWIIGLIVTFSVDDNSDYQLQSKSWAVNLVKAAGFVCIIIGTMIYNKLLFNSWLGDQKGEPTDVLSKDDLMQDSLIVTEELRFQK